MQRNYVYITRIYVYKLVKLFLIWFIQKVKANREKKDLNDHVLKNLNIFTNNYF